MTIKVIVELKAHPGRRDELRAVFESMLSLERSSTEPTPKVKGMPTETSSTFSVAADVQQRGE